MPTIVSSYKDHSDLIQPFADQGDFLRESTERYTDAGLAIEEAQVFAKATRRLISFTDTVEDPDAELTIAARHLCEAGKDRAFSIDRPEELLYLGDLVVELQDVRIETIARAIMATRGWKKDADFRHLHIDTRNALREIETTTLRVILNSAARNHNVATGKNGENYSLGVTDNGIEIYGVPRLSYSLIRDRLIALFDISSEGHPLFPDGEQFRSSIVAGTASLAPEHLQRIWTPGSGDIAEHVPDPEHNNFVGFVDRFHNRRIRVANLAAFWEEVQSNATDGFVNIRVGTTTIPCFITTQLSKIPGGKFGIYKNVADLDHHGPGYVEVNRRVDDNAPISDAFSVQSEQCASHHINDLDRKIGVLVSVISK